MAFTKKQLLQLQVILAHYGTRNEYKLKVHERNYPTPIGHPEKEDVSIGMIREELRLIEELLDECSKQLKSN